MLSKKLCKRCYMRHVEAEQERLPSDVYIDVKTEFRFFYDMWAEGQCPCYLPNDVYQSLSVIKPPPNNCCYLLEQTVYKPSLWDMVVYYFYRYCWIRFDFWE